MVKGKPRSRSRKAALLGGVAAFCFFAISPEGQRLVGLLADFLYAVLRTSFGIGP